MTRLDLIAELPPNTIGCEVGVQRGCFAEQILKLSVAKLHLVDCWQHQSGDYEDDPANVDSGGQAENERVVRAKFAGEIASGRVSIHKGFSQWVALEFSGESLDWCVIDADHSYQAVLADLHAWSRAVTSDGAILVHDYTACERALRMRFGVMEAVREFEALTDWSVFRITDEPWPTAELKRQ